MPFAPAGRRVVGMTKDQWTELQSLLKQYKRAEARVDKLKAKLAEAAASADELATRVRAALEKGP